MAKAKSGKSEAKKGVGRVPLYVDGLDSQIQGGVPEGHVNLVCGVSGTMKSSLCFNVLYNEALRGRSSVYITLEQSSISLMQHFSNLGFDFSKVNVVNASDRFDIKKNLGSGSGKGSIVFIDVSAMRKEAKKTRQRLVPYADWFGMIKSIVTEMKAAGCDIFVLDSMSALYILTKFDSPRADLFYFFEFFRELGITSFFISEMPLSRNRYGEYQVEDFLVDGIIKLDLVERNRKVTREISVVKLRGTKCNQDVFSLEYEKGRFRALYGGQPPLM